MPTGADFITDPDGAMKRLVEKYKRTEFAPAFQQTSEQMAQQTRLIAEMRYGDEFKRWGKEIDGYLSTYPSETRANPKAWELAVKHVRAEHIDQLVAEQIESKLKSGTLANAALSPHGAPGGGPSLSTPGSIDLNSDKIPPRFKALLSQRGISVREVDEFLAATQPNVSPEKRWETYMKQLEGGDIHTDGREMSFRKTGDTGAAIDETSPYVTSGWQHVRSR